MQHIGRVQPKWSLIMATRNKANLGKNIFAMTAIIAAWLFMAPGATPTAEAKGPLCNQGDLKPVVAGPCKKSRVTAISCFRSQAHQNRIRAYFCSIGRCGQAARVSNHTRGLACDMASNAPDMLRSQSGSTGLKLLKSRSHRGFHYSPTGR